MTVCIEQRREMVKKQRDGKKEKFWRRMLRRRAASGICGPGLPFDPGQAYLRYIMHLRAPLKEDPRGGFRTADSHADNGLLKAWCGGSGVLALYDRTGVVDQCLPFEGAIRLGQPTARHNEG